MSCGKLQIALAVMVAASQPVFGVTLSEPIKPIPQSLNQDPARAEIGRQLFQDVRLSANASVSCSTCHDLTKGGADGRSRSIGFSGTPTDLNAPSVLNAAFNFKQFWNGRADSLEAQIDAAVQNSAEMGSKWEDVASKISGERKYNVAFASAYKDGVTKSNIQDAIATYERTLITPNSRFDRYLRGDPKAISGDELAGYEKFKQYGCVTCHQGVNVGGNMFQKFGVIREAPSRADRPAADLGRYGVTGSETDKHVFKVPSLRNVALTAPYLHDASAKTLEDAVDVMFRYQLGRTASREDKAQIVKFLNTLTGELPAQP